MPDVLERVGPAQIPRFFFSFCFFGLAGLVLWLSLSHVKSNIETPKRSEKRSENGPFSRIKSETVTKLSLQ